jgi:hypothetical protein
MFKKVPLSCTLIAKLTDVDSHDVWRRADRAEQPQSVTILRIPSPFIFLFYAYAPVIIYCVCGSQETRKLKLM